MKTGVDCAAKRSQVVMQRSAPHVATPGRAACTIHDAARTVPRPCTGTHFDVVSFAAVPTANITGARSPRIVVYGLLCACRINISNSKFVLCPRSEQQLNEVTFVNSAVL